MERQYENRKSIDAQEPTSKRGKKKLLKSKAIRVVLFIVLVAAIYLYRSAEFSQMHERMYNNHYDELEILAETVTQYDSFVAVRSRHGVYQIHGCHNNSGEGINKNLLKKQMSFLPYGYYTYISYTKAAESAPVSFEIKTKQQNGNNYCV